MQLVIDVVVAVGFRGVPRVWCWFRYGNTGDCNDDDDDDDNNDDDDNDDDNDNDNDDDYNNNDDFDDDGLVC